MSIGVAIIGGGIFAKAEHLPALLSLSSIVTLKAVYSRTLASCAALTADLAHKTDFYSDETVSQGAGYADLLARTDIKAVIIALPITAQPPYITQALTAGKHVLSEKPIAATHAEGASLLSHFNSLDAHSSTGAARPTWSVAENWRTMETHAFAAAEIARLGRLLHFHVHADSSVAAGGKYYETPWRKTPAYQGGFLLDGGIHHIAALRLLLGPLNAPARVSALTSQTQPHLPPVDTLTATISTRSGAPGTFSLAYGSTLPRGQSYAFACERGSVVMTRGEVRVHEVGEAEVVKTWDEGMGVVGEVGLWVAGLESGVVDARLGAVEGLKDLQLLEAMLGSGEEGGRTFDVSPVESERKIS